MKGEVRNYIGVDLTQHKPILGFASTSERAESIIPEINPPAVLLPAFRGESIIAGPGAHKHRRGVGLSWPPECQVPVGNDHKNGTGRIPLVCAWSKLASLSKQQFSGFLGDTEIAWWPPGQKKLYSSAEKIIAQSTIEWAKHYSSKQNVLVIPDNLGEAAQQAILENTPESFLIPRPIAVAMSWCRKNAPKYDGQISSHKEGTPVGHLLVITMAYDQWEVVPIAIRARKYKEQIWLIPVRNRVIGCEFPRVGINFFLSLAENQAANLHSVWHQTIGTGHVNQICTIWDKVLRHEKSVKECITKGMSDTNRSVLHGFDLFGPFLSQQTNFSPSGFKDALESLYKTQLKTLPEGAQNKCLGAVIDGACSSIPIAKNRTIGEFVSSAFGDLQFSIFDGAVASHGAALTAYALGHSLPSYRETITPIDIHYHGKNAKGDYVNRYKLLVEGTTVGAGEEYKSKEPVTGLKIQQGERSLTLTLRRLSAGREFVFRKVTAEIPQQTRTDEEVQIKANLRPGQGFAKVLIDSVNTNVFSTLLNWRSMEECEEPPPPPLAYLPEVSRVVHDDYMWRDSECYVEDATRVLRTGGDIVVAMRDLRNGGKFNQLPMADNYDKFRGRVPQGDIFRHYGVCPSNGDLSSVTDPDLLKEFALEAAKAFANNRSLVQRKQIQQTASWMYLACPPNIINSARTNLSKNLAQTKQEDLHTIGLCWCESEDIKTFFFALEERLLQGTQGVNNWLRACRNIVRFRDSALHQGNIPKRRLENIVSRILRILDNQIVERNFATIFNNCILTSLYLLKRRRYDKDFLNGGSHESYVLDTALENLLKKHTSILSSKQYTIIKVTLKFLRKEASLKDLDSSILTG